MLLSLATGAGKTIIAANLLWRLHEAGRLPKPALFICDRDELRGQAYTNLKDWDNAIARVTAGGQAIVHQRVDTQVNDTFWVQATTTPSSAMRPRP